MEKIPILKMGEFLLVTIQVDMHDRLAMALQDDLTRMISQTEARGVLIDISTLEIVDSFIGRMLSNIAGMSRICRRGHAARCGDNVSGTGIVPARCTHCAERGRGHGSVTTFGRRDVGDVWPSSPLRLSR